MKIVLQDKKKYRGTGVEYPYPEAGKRFKVILRYHPEDDVCCITYIANKGDFGEAKKKIEDLCMIFDIKYKFIHSRKVEALHLHHLFVDERSLEILMDIDETLNLPRPQLE